MLSSPSGQARLLRSRRTRLPLRLYPSRFPRSTLRSRRRSPEPSLLRLFALSDPRELHHLAGSKDLCAIPEPTDSLAPKIIFPNMFQPGGSSGDATLQGSQQFQRPVPTGSGQKKTASFNSQVVAQTYTSSAIRDTENDYESAIDDDDED